MWVRADPGPFRHRPGHEEDRERLLPSEFVPHNDCSSALRRLRQYPQPPAPSAPTPSRRSIRRMRAHRVNGPMIRTGDATTRSWFRATGGSTCPHGQQLGAVDTLMSCPDGRASSLERPCKSYSFR